MVNLAHFYTTTAGSKLRHAASLVVALEDKIPVFVKFVWMYLAGDGWEGRSMAEMEAAFDTFEAEKVC